MMWDAGQITSSTVINELWREIAQTGFEVEFWCEWLFEGGLMTFRQTQSSEIVWVWKEFMFTMAQNYEIRIKD